MEQNKASLGGLSFLWLEITPKCNLECVHCYADAGPRVPLLGQMSTDMWLRVLADAAGLGCQDVQFIGGEPTLHPGLAQMISFAAAQGYTFIEVFTNATRIDPRFVSTMLTHRVQAAVSFYSDKAEVHDFITKSPGSFRHTVSNIKAMITAGVPVRAGIIEMNENRGHVPGAQVFLESLGVHNINVDMRRDVGRGLTSPDVGNQMAALCGECWKGKLCVTSAGKIFPCVFSRFAEVGSAVDGLRSALIGSRLQTFRNDFRQYSEEHRIGMYAPSSEAPSVLSREHENRIGREILTQCNPTCSPCSPADFIECAPGRTQCNPDFQACSPLAKCVPSSGACGPETRCSPSNEPSRDYRPRD